MEYLKEKQYYVDLYDLFTIKECLELISDTTEAYKKLLQEDEESASKSEMAKASNWSTNQMLFLIKAKRYKFKDETIQEWMTQDQIEQEKYDMTPEPRSIRCTDCKKLMHSTLKHLETFDNPLRMMFLFNCSACKKKRWIYEDGTERESTPDLCPKCKAEVIISVVEKEKDKVTWKISCSACGCKETKVEDFAKQRIERKKKEEWEKKLLQIHRELYCSEEKGKEAFEYIEALKVAHVVYDEELKKFDSLAYQKVASLKKLSISDLKKLLYTTLEKEKYNQLLFDKPEIGKHIIISFSAQDANSSRKESISISQMQKTIESTLEGTNWRLMSEGLSYRLGYLSGRLKGYDREEDFFELSGQKKEEKTSKIDYEIKMKYEGHNVVQLARAMGGFKGRKNVRERRLKQDPDGFFLNSVEDTYTCGICSENTPGNKTWWNLDGVRCADCQRNIKEGIISSEIHKNRDSWVAGWELTSEYDFNIYSTTVKKLRKEGLLHGRDLKREDGTIYFTVYILNENKRFLKKYPRKSRPRMVITDLLGKKVEL